MKGLHPVCKQLLSIRGIEDAESFLSPPKTSDPSELPGVTRAADRICEAARNGERITVFGDYDCDGTCGTSILMHAFQDMGVRCNYFIPNRYDGYGFGERNAEVISRMSEVIITTDCGIQDVAACEVANANGCTVLVTDHHNIGATLPPAHAIVHPGLDGYHTPQLCGAGVALKLVTELFLRGTGITQDTLIKCVSLASFATIADCVDLRSLENRAIVKRGLANAHRVPTAYALLDSDGFVKSEDVSFGLAPKINAIGRLDDARHAVELLMGDTSKIQFATDLNEKRKEEQKRIFEEAMEQAEGQRHAVVVSGDWAVGVVGIVAGKLAEKFKMPAVVISEGEERCSGSARGALGINVNELLQKCRHYLISCGGHAAAAGLKIKKDKMSIFRSIFQEYAEKAAREDAGPEYDMELDLSETCMELAYSLDSLEPFGVGFQRPVFKTSTVVREASRLKNNTLKLELMGNQKAIGFGLGDKAEQLERGQSIDILYTLGWSEWRGKRRKELMITGIN